jgi:hypothetical protein
MEQGCHTGRPEANGLVGGLAHYARRKLGILDIFSKYLKKIPRIYSNKLKYAQIYSNFFLSGERGGLPGKAGGRGGGAA